MGKEKAKAKDDLKAKIEEVQKDVESAEETIKKAEEETTAENLEKATPMESAELTTFVEQMDAVINDAKSSVSGAKDKVAALGEDVEAELKDFLAEEVKKL